MTLEETSTALVEAQNNLSNTLTNLQSIVGQELAPLPNEYLRIARQHIREAVVSAANSIEALNMIPLVVKQKEECQPELSSSQQEPDPDSTSEQDTSTKLS